MDEPKRDEKVKFVLENWDLVEEDTKKMLEVLGIGPGLETY